MGNKYSREDRLWKEVDEEGWWRFQTPARYVFFLFIVILIIVGLWFLFAPTPQATPVENLPMIQAASGNYKVKMDDSYVSSVPHQDKLVYQRIARNQSMEQREEHILPSPEKPKTLIQYEEPILVGSESEPHLKMTQEYNPDEEQPTLEKVKSSTDIGGLIEEVDPISSLIQETR